MSKSVFLGAALLGCLLMSMPAQATSLVINGSGQLTGAKGVLVGASLFNVKFVEGSCWDVFGQCMTSAFSFPNDAATLVAGNALMSQVFIDGPAGSFDSDPSKTFGCASEICKVLIPYRSSGGLVVHAVVAENHVDEADDVVAGFRTDPFSSTANDERVWALWKPAAVPEASTFVLLGIGLAAMQVRGRVSNRRSRS